MVPSFDICIRGTGIVGRTLALLLARERLKVALVSAPGPHSAATADVRAYALNAASRSLLESLRSWPDAEHATAVKHMQVQGDQDGCVHFDAAPQGVEALAWIVDVPALEERLAQSAKSAQLNVAQILVTVPEGATAEVAAQRQARAAQALTRLRAGEDFGKVARELSEDANRETGGELGLRPSDRLPDLFVAAVKNLAIGQFTPEPVRSAASERCSAAQRGLASLLPPAATLARVAAVTTDCTPSTPRMCKSKRSTAFITGQRRQASPSPSVSA